MLDTGALSLAEIPHSWTKTATISIATMTRSESKMQRLPPLRPTLTLPYASSVRGLSFHNRTDEMAC